MSDVVNFLNGVRKDAWITLVGGNSDDLPTWDGRSTADDHRKQASSAAPAPAPTDNRNDRTAEAASNLLGGVSLTPGGEKGSLYGLGAASDLPVNGALFPVTAGQSGKVTAEDTVKAFATLNNPSLVAQIQKQLLLGGFYSGDYTPNYGVLNKKDIDAFAELVGTAARTGADVHDYLGRQAQFGAYQGVAAAVAARKQAQTRTIQKEDPRALRSMIEKEFVSLVGHKPDATEAAAFVTAFDAAYSHAQRANYAAADTATDTGGQPGFSDDPSNFSTAATPPTPGSPAAFRAAEEKTSGRTMPFQPTMPDLPPEASSAPAEVTQQAFDPGAFAEDYVRRTQPVAVGAHDVTGQFSTFLEILKGMG